MTAYVGEEMLAGVDGVLEAVIAWVRGEIRSAKRYELSTDELELPVELKHAVCNLVMECVMNRLNFVPTEGQQEAIREARKLIERVAKGKLVLSTPDKGETRHTRKVIDLVSGRSFDATNFTMKGL